MYIRTLEQIPLVAFAMIPNDHELVFRKENNPNKALQDTKFGCSHTSRLFYLLKGTAKQFLRLVLSVQCRSDREERILDSHLHPQNFRTRLEEAGRILREHVLSSGDKQLVAHMNLLLELCETIRKSAAAVQIESGSSHPNGEQGHAKSGELPQP